MTSLINLAFDENGQKAAKIDLNALLNEDYRQIKPKPKTIPLQPKARFCLDVEDILYSHLDDYVHSFMKPIEVKR